MSARATFVDRLITDQSALDTVGVIGPGRGSQVREITLYATFGQGTSLGTVVLEAAPHSDYSGTWANLGTIAWSAANKVGSLSVTGVHLAIRARISVAVVGGTVNVDIIGN